MAYRTEKIRIIESRRVAILINNDERNRLLASWEAAPDARACHPRSEHLVPIFVAAGAGGSGPGRRVFSGAVMGMAVSGFAFG